MFLSPCLVRTLKRTWFRRNYGESRNEHTRFFQCSIIPIQISVIARLVALTFRDSRVKESICACVREFVWMFKSHFPLEFIQNPDSGQAGHEKWFKKEGGNVVIVFMFCSIYFVCVDAREIRMCSLDWSQSVEGRGICSQTLKPSASPPQPPSTLWPRFNSVRTFVNR